MEVRLRRELHEEVAREHRDDRAPDGGPWPLENAREIALESALGDRPLSHLIRRRPAVRIGHCGKCKPVGGGALAVTQHTVQLAHVVGDIPRAIVFVGFDGREEYAFAHWR